jgi:hypothetical protein
MLHRQFESLDEAFEATLAEIAAFAVEWRARKDAALDAALAADRLLQEIG